MKTLKDWLKIDVNGQLAPRHVNLLIQKMTADDDDVYSSFCYSKWTLDTHVTNLAIIPTLTKAALGAFAAALLTCSVSAVQYWPACTV